MTFHYHKVPVHFMDAEIFDPLIAHLDTFLECKNLRQELENVRKSNGLTDASTPAKPDHQKLTRSLHD